MRHVSFSPAKADPATPVRLLLLRGISLAPSRSDISRVYAARRCPSASRCQHDLDTLVLLLAKHLVGLRCLLERQPVRDDEGRVDFPFLDPLQERFHITL